MAGPGWARWGKARQDRDIARGPVGTTFRIHLKGVGWSETANIVHVVYDNSYIGYACAFNSQRSPEVCGAKRLSVPISDHDCPGPSSSFFESCQLAEGASRI